MSMRAALLLALAALASFTSSLEIDETCSGVVCHAHDSCHDFGVCEKGFCSNPLKSNGFPC